MKTDETKRLREIAASIIADSNEEGRIKNAAELLKLASEIENQTAGASKLATEEQKLNFDLRESRGHRNSEDRKAYITLLAPVFTTLVLAGTLILQSYQFAQSEKDKQAESRQQRDAADDVRWADTVKLLSQSNKLSPAGALLTTFSTTPRYKEQARQQALQLLRSTLDAEEFKNLFGFVFEPIGWKDVPEVLKLNRDSYLSLNPVLQKIWDPTKQGRDALGKLDPEEQKQLDGLDKVISFTCSEIAPVLRKPRPSGGALDLHLTDLYQCDLQGADLSGANMDGANLTSVNLNGANLQGVTHEGLGVYATAWWEASQMSPDLLQYLLEKSPFQPEVGYGPLYQKITKKGYDDNVARLLKSGASS
jgi:hypothetical protein